MIERSRAPSGIHTMALTALALSALMSASTLATAQAIFGPADADYHGQVRIQAQAEGQPILPGSAVKITGENFKPSQHVTISWGPTSVSAEPLVANAEGKFEGAFTLPKDAAVGVHPLVVATAAPYNAEVVELKVSPDVPLSGADKFTIEAKKLVPGLYQTAYSAKSDVLFVTASTGRPPVKDSAILKVDPRTLEILARGTPTAAPARPDGTDGGVFAVYGIAIDDVNGTVWVTNTRQNTVAVYRQDDLSLVKQFEPGIVTHARDVAVDPVNGKVYASQVGVPAVVAFDAKSLEVLTSIEIASNNRREEFSPTSLKFDEASGKLLVVSMTTPEVAIIDTKTDAVDKVVPVTGVRGAIGVAYDAASKSIFVAAQGSDNLAIVNAETGETVHTVAVGAGSLNVTFEPVGHLAYVSNRNAGTVTAVDLDGKIVANLENSPLANHVIADGKGNVFALNKGRGGDEASDNITRITPAR